MKLPLSHFFCASRGHSVRWALVSLVVAFGWPEILHAAAPVVSNVRASQRAGTQLVDILYDVNDPDSSVVSVSVLMSSDAGASYSVPINTLSGAHGAGVSVGLNRQIVWNAGVDWAGRFSSQCKVRIVVDDGTAPFTPPGMVYIPAGTFQMGDNFFEGSTSELPVHTVFVSGFFMDRYEVTYELWYEVYTWAIGHGYSFVGFGGGSPGLPIQGISWLDAVLWCNARSEKEGYIPAYYTEALQTNVVRNPAVIGNSDVKWTANGYRLPTEAEWEKAARGGQSSKRYPWGNTATASDARYAINSPAAVGSYPANGYGLHDMAGNVMEWCWDNWSSPYYGQPAASADNPAGPVVFENYRVIRGGSHYDTPHSLRCAIRSQLPPGIGGSSYLQVGFRSVKRP